MTKADVYNTTGKKISSTNIDESIYETEINKNLLQQAVYAYLANNRKSTADVKTRSEVRGGGAKPFKQKGTGRARAGTSRSPLWIGGGIIFGPSKEINYKKRLSKKMKVKALKSAIGLHINDKSLLLVDIKKDLNKPATSKLNDLLYALPQKDKKTLFVVNKKIPNVKKSISNLVGIKVLDISNLNVFDLVKYPRVIFVKDDLLRLFHSQDKNSDNKIKKENK